MQKNKNTLNSRFLSINKLEKEKDIKEDPVSKNLDRNGNNPVNWVHPKKFRFLRALKHTNPEGNRLKHLSISKEKPIIEASRERNFFKFNSIGRYTGGMICQTLRTNLKSFRCNYSSRKIKTPPKLPYRTIFPDEFDTVIYCNWV